MNSDRITVSKTSNKINDRLLSDYILQKWRQNRYNFEGRQVPENWTRVDRDVTCKTVGAACL